MICITTFDTFFANQCKLLPFVFVVVIFLNLLQTILPIAVFGGLGLGALAWVDSINRYNNLCNKVSVLTMKSYSLKYRKNQKNLTTDFLRRGL